MFFGFSLTKLIFTVLVIVVVWKGFKFFGRLQDIKIRTRKTENLKRRAAAQTGNKAGNKAGEKAGNKAGKVRDKTEDMTECSVCTTFVVASGAEACGRDDCPYK